MLFVEHARPSPELAPYLYGYVQRVSDPREPEIVEPVLARSGSMLIFQFDDQYDVPAYGLDLPNLSVPITIIGPIPLAKDASSSWAGWKSSRCSSGLLASTRSSAFRSPASPAGERRVAAFLERRCARSMNNWETSGPLRIGSKLWSCSSHGA